jgi:hypothetical protein
LGNIQNVFVDWSWVYLFSLYNNGMDIMKYKVIRDYPTASGILYKEEVVKEDGNSTLKGHIRVKDNMGRIWFVPKENLAKKK